MAAAPIHVGLVGIGNCASSFVQGLHHYRDAAPGDDVPGLMSPDLGGYRVRDVAVVSAFDVSAAKVGRDLADAILAKPAAGAGGPEEYFELFYHAPRPAR